MKLTSALRTPYRTRTIVRSGATEQLNETRLVRAAVLTQLTILALCAARIATDWVRGPLSVEGHIAFVLFIAVGVSLAAKAAAWMVRGAGPAHGHPPSRPPALALVKAKDVRAT